MKITYDKEADAMYVKFTDEKFSKVQVLDRKTILNLDKEGNIIGIELLSVSKRFPKHIPTSIPVENLSS